MASTERAQEHRQTGPPLRIRRMRSGDVGRVLNIEHVSYSTPWSEATFRGLLKRSDADLYVADSGDDLVGYAIFWAVGPDGELGNIAVSEEARGHGIAQRLLEQVLDGARKRGVIRVFLEVRTSNRAARRLYRKYGFHQVGRRSGYYHSPVEDALVLCRKLEDEAAAADN